MTPNNSLVYNEIKYDIQWWSWHIFKKIYLHYFSLTSYKNHIQVRFIFY